MLRTCLVIAALFLPALSFAQTPTPLPQQPPQTDWDSAALRRERVLHVVRFSMETGGGLSRTFEDGGYSAATPSGFVHGRLRIGAVTGVSLGPTLTLEGSANWQRPGDMRCDREPCTGAAPDSETRV